MHNNGSILFIVNPVAGGKDKQDWQAQIEDFFKDGDSKLKFFMLTGQQDKGPIQECIEAFAPDKVVAVGGDGTIKMIAEIVKETSMVLGIIPGGSANGLAKELGIPLDLKQALTIITDGEQKGLDAIRINEEHLSFHLSDVGLNALLVKYFEESPRRGMWGYGRSLLKMVVNKRQMRVTIETDTETVKRKAYMVALANAEKYGTGAVINPDGNPFDGVFEIVVVRKINMLQIFKALMARKDFDSSKIEVFRTKNVTLTFQQKAPFQIDGEYMGKTAKLKARILPKIVQVMTPGR